MIEGKRVVITGVAGSIGSELARQLVAAGNEVWGIDNDETGWFDLVEEIGIKGQIGDIRDRRTMEEFFGRTSRFDYVFHAAARKHVSPMEAQPREAVETNLVGLLNTLEAAQKNNVGKIVFISSDKACGHTVMGLTKALGERMVQNAGGICVRFGNVLGSRGSLIPLIERQLDQKRPVTITDKRCERYFMTIEEACSLVIEAALAGGPGDCLILDMGKPVNILELAKKIIAEAKVDADIKMIGLRSGEQLTEKLMTEDEERVAVKRGKFWVIPYARN